MGRADETTEDYAYAATFQLAGLIAERAGDDGLTDVWQAAVDGEYAYQPSTPAPRRRPAARAARLARPPGPARGAHDANYTDLWREWVVRPEEARLLDDRAQARDGVRRGRGRGRGLGAAADCATGDVGLAVRPGEDR